MALRPIALPLLLCLCACASGPGAVDAPPVQQAAAHAAAVNLAATYAALAQQGGQVFRMVPERSSIRAYAFRAGRGAKFGHNHVLSAPTFEGYLYLAPQGNADSRFDLALRLDQLVFDVPEHRAALGPAFASAISAEDTASTRNNMLGDNNFQAARYPWLRIRSVQIVGEAPKLAAKVAINLHGQTREQWTPLTVTGLPGEARAQGMLVIRQSDFGIKPFSVFGGILAVHDEVVVEFSLATEPQ